MISVGRTLAVCGRRTNQKKTILRRRNKANTSLTVPPSKMVSSATVQVLFFVGILVAYCQAQEVSKKVTKEAKYCFPNVNGAKFNDTGKKHQNFIFPCKVYHYWVRGLHR